MLGEVARPGPPLLLLHHPASFEPDPGPDPFPVPFDADQQEPHRVAGLGAAPVLEEFRRAAIVGEREVEVPVEVVVEAGEAPAHPGAGEVALAPGAAHETPVVVPEHLAGLGEGEVRLDLRDVVQDVAVRHHQVEPAVVVEVGEVAAEGQLGEALAPQSERRRRVQEEAPAEVPVERVRLEIEVRDHEVHPPVAVHVPEIVPHAGFRKALLVVRDAGRETFLEEPDAVRPGGRPEEEVGGGVVRHVDIGRAVPFQIGDHHAEALPVFRAGHRRRPEGAVAKILEERIGRARVLLRMAVGEEFADRADAVPVPLDRVVEVVRGVDVEVAVAVRIEERRARGPAGIGRAAGARRLPERAVSPVPEEPLLPEVGDQQVGVAVAVEVARDRTHAVVEAVRRIQEPGFLGAVPEGAVPPVPEETVPDRRAARVARERMPVHEEEVGPAVAVVVEHRDSGADDLDHVAPAAAAVLVVEADPGRLGPVHEDEVLARRRRRGEERGEPEADRVHRRGRPFDRVRDSERPGSSPAAAASANRRRTAAASSVRPSSDSAAARL